MRNNRERKVFRGRSFWPNLAEWLEEVNSQRDPKEHINCVHEWFDAFIITDEADDQELRSRVLLMRNNLLNLFTVMDCYTSKQRQKQLEKLL